MIDETAAGPALSNASHCASKSGSETLPASSGTSGPQPARNFRKRVSCAASRTGGGSGIQRLMLKPPLVDARTSAAQVAISSGLINKAPHAPSPPALATAIESEGGHAPAMGASKIGTRKPKRLQKVV